MIEINRAKVGEGRVDYRVEDLFAWQPTEEYDFVFFGFWLSHVPAERFEELWAKIATALRPGGRFFFVDNLRSRSNAIDHPLTPEGATEQERILNDGRRFRIVKIFYEPEELRTRLTNLGWSTSVKATAEFFIHGSGSRLA